MDLNGGLRIKRILGFKESRKQNKKALCHLTRAHGLNPCNPFSLLMVMLHKQCQN